ncbi:MAG TPA: class I SAM-dependent DNA methyltransferase, partial [Gammaproteobacteria bacterium]|nr:class I SAM-dependent DNA methyltransferase [Gammaproteobacteria bacterium]
MTPDQFIAKWQDATLKERSAAQEHFIDLCRLLEEPTPADADPSGSWYCFERGAAKAGGGDGWADVWKRGCFGWEYKGKGKDLKAAFKQLQLYTPALEYPPLLIVCDLEQIVIHTAFTGTVPAVHVLALEDLRDARQRRLLKWAFAEPERLRPGQTMAALTEEAAQRFGRLAQTLRTRGHASRVVGHFCIRLLFCLFAEDIELLPRQMFTRLLDAGLKNPASLAGMLEDLFGAMATGGRIGFEPVDWFNGGLFDSRDALPLEVDDIKTLRGLAGLDWSAIEPSIFGTLFERGLDPDKRSQLGAHYTDRDSILRLVNPVVLDPLRDEWTARKAGIEALMAKAAMAKSPATRTKAQNEAQAILQGFLARLADFRILDPACGSGNFLLLSLLGLKDLEHQVILEAEGLGLPRAFPQVGPENVLGIEINPYAAELARVTVWMGEIQWMLAHGFSLAKNPILKPLHTIEQRDAVLNPDGTEPEWPAAEVIVGNPPFLGGSKLLRELGDDYTARMRQAYAGRVPCGADLVCYWFEKARGQIEAGHAQRAGLIATNSIRGGQNRKVLERIRETSTLFHAWSDEPWVNQGASVRVSLIGFGTASSPVILNGQPMTAIYADLTGQALDMSGVDLTQARPLAGIAGVCCYGSQQKGQFEIAGEEARQLLAYPNPHGQPNSEVVKRAINAKQIMDRPRDDWVIDFGLFMPEDEAMLYEKPYEIVTRQVKPARLAGRDQGQKRRWWLHARPSPLYRQAQQQFSRCIATPAVAKYRLFVWLDSKILADHALIVFTRTDDATFGILHSRFHEQWALRLGTSLGSGPRYTPTTCFETFPFPAGLTPNIPAADYADDPRAQAIADAARKLNELRENWLNPP